MTHTKLTHDPFLSGLLTDGTN